MHPLILVQQKCLFANHFFPYCLLNFLFSNVNNNFFFHSVVKVMGICEGLIIF